VSYAFGDFVLDLQLFQLRQGEHIIPLEPKVFDVLRYLVEHHDRVATKRELLDALWPNEVVTEAVLPTNINALRRALGQGRGEKTPIETVHGRGYRFSMPVVRGRSMPAPGTPSLPPRPGVDDDEEPFVGQTALLEKLKRALTRTLAEQGQICILRGEAGIGKSRIAKRIATLARSQGADVWTGACPEGLGTPALWVWQEVLRSVKASEGVSGMRRFLGASAAELSPWLHELLEDAEDSLLARGERDRFRLYDTFVRLLSGASKVRPRVLVLEDLHRADDASWQLLRLLAPHLESLAVLVLCTVRSRDDLTIAMSVQRHVEDLARLPFCQRFQVNELDEPETRTLLDKLLKRPVNADLARLLYQKAGGNPLFLRELADWISSTGQDDPDALREAPGLSPPELVRRVLLRRVERLGERSHRLLSAASVAGTAFELGCIAAVTEMDRAQAMDVVDAAVGTRVIAPLPDHLDRYRFAHELIRDTLYAELRGQERKLLHRKIAEYMTQKGRTQNAQAVKDIAVHYYRALPEGDIKGAIRWISRAAAECEREGAFGDAARFFRCALDAGRLVPDAEADELELSSLHEALERVTRRSRAAKAEG
jgi:predicted ATPase/DNA-binding winged helix-turn-helix (wHTH) protein